MSFLKAFHSDLITGIKRCAHCLLESVVERSSGPLCNNRQSQIMTPSVKMMTMMMIRKMAVSLFSRLVIMGFRTLMVANKATYKWYCALIHLHRAQSPSWEANSSSASQEILRILWNPKVNCRFQNSPPPVSILGQINPAHALTS